MIASEVVRAVALTKLPDQTKVALLVLWSYVNAADPVPVVWPSIAGLAAAVDCDRRAAARHLARLREAGLLRRGDAMTVRRGDRLVHVEHPLVLILPPVTERALVTDEAPRVVTERAPEVVTEESLGSDRASTRNSPTEISDPNPPINPVDEPVGGLLTHPPATPPPKPIRRGLPRTSLPDGLAQHTFDEIHRAYREIIGKSGGPRKITPGMLDALSKLYASEEPTPEEMTRAIETRARLDRDKRGYGELSWEHICRAASFRRYRDGDGGKAPAPARKAWSSQSGDDPDEAA